MHVLDLKTAKTRKMLEPLKDPALDELTLVKGLAALKRKQLFSCYELDVLRGQMDYIPRHLYYLYPYIYPKTYSAEVVQRAQDQVKQNFLKQTYLSSEEYEKVDRAHIVSLYDRKVFKMLTNDISLYVERKDPGYAG